jgi:hypothetical protein
MYSIFLNMKATAALLYMYRCEELQGGGEEGEEEWQHGVTQAVQGGCGQLIVVVHVISATLYEA